MLEPPIHRLLRLSSLLSSVHALEEVGRPPHCADLALLTNMVEESVLALLFGESDASERAQAVMSEVRDFALCQLTQLVPDVRGDEDALRYATRLASEREREGDKDGHAVWLRVKELLEGVAR